MPPKRKAKDTIPIQKQKKSKNEPSERVEWHDHEDWTLRLLQLLLDKQTIYIGLFGGTQGKRTRGTTKIQHQRVLADLLWDCDEVEDADRQNYLNNKERHVKALGNHLTAVQKKYRELRAGLGETGAGVTGDEETGADSILEHIEAEYTWWPLADELWHSAPKCDADIVSNSATGAARGKRTLDSAVTPQAINLKEKSDDASYISDEGSKVDVEVESTSEKRDVGDQGGDEASTASTPDEPDHAYEKVQKYITNGRRPSLADTDTSSHSCSGTPARSNKHGAGTPKSRACVSEFTEALRDEAKSNEVSEANRNQRVTRRFEIKAEERRVKLEAKVTKSQKQLDYEHQKVQFAHEKVKLELENERLRLQIQLANANAMPNLTSMISNSLMPASTSAFPHDPTVVPGQPFI